MRLLNTKTGRLKLFDDPAQLPPYAILSHVWQRDEQVFQDVVRLSDKDDPRSYLSPKIRMACIFAEKESFEWIWIDTCCIDKSSSSELQEAINSMYSWYARAEICYAYMHDVEDTHPSHHDSFKDSGWFQRGWTLQELIAPPYVVFLSRGWHTLGTKQTLANQIEHITTIDSDVLLRLVDLDKISVARRMSWASSRRTTREEDRAYSLMGIFGVNMPTIYGEGPQAFIRLQLEILKRCSDQSIFAWGDRIDIAEIRRGAIPTLIDRDFELQTPRSLLAPSPSDFAHSRDIQPVTLDELGALIEMEIIPPEHVHTSYGMRTSLPTLAIGITREPAVCIAILTCQDSYDNIIVLLLHQRLRTLNAPYGFYHVGADLSMVFDDHCTPTFTNYYRIGSVSRHLLCEMRSQYPSWLGQMYIECPMTPASAAVAPRISPPVSSDNGSISYAFFFPAWVFKWGRVTLVDDEQRIVQDEDSDGFMLEVSPTGHRNRRSVIFSQNLDLDGPLSQPEGFRLSVWLDCPCDSSPLQHPVSFTVDMIMPSPRHSPASSTHSHSSASSPSHARPRSRSLSAMLNNISFAQLMLQRTPSPSRSVSDLISLSSSQYGDSVGSIANSRRNPADVYSHMHVNDSDAWDTPLPHASTYPSGDGSAQGTDAQRPWQCAQQRTHIPTIANPAILMKFLSGIGSVELALKRWERCHRSKATYVYIVDLRMLSLRQHDEPERKSSLPTYTTGVIPQSGVILYDAPEDVDARGRSENALQLRGDWPMSPNSIQFEFDGPSDDEADSDSEYSPVTLPTFRHEISHTYLHPGHVRRHSSPDPPSPATTYYSFPPSPVPVPQHLRSRHGSFSEQPRYSSPPTRTLNSSPSPASDHSLDSHFTLTSHHLPTAENHHIRRSRPESIHGHPSPYSHVPHSYSIAHAPQSPHVPTSPLPLAPDPDEISTLSPVRVRPDFESDFPTDVDRWWPPAPIPPLLRDPDSGDRLPWATDGHTLAHALHSEREAEEEEEFDEEGEGNPESESESTQAAIHAPMPTRPYTNTPQYSSASRDQVPARPLPVTHIQAPPLDSNELGLNFGSGYFLGRDHTLGHRPIPSDW